LKSRILLSFFLLFVLGAQLFALGKQDETDVKTQNDEWILCVTDFDIKSMPAEKLNIAGVITKKIVERLSVINYRTRVSPEYAYYEGYAWARARTSAAKALSAKQDERALQVYRGDPSWKYRQNLARIDADIEKLKTALEEVENNAPPINREPVFNLTPGNLASSFPAAPKAGSERKFCLDQKADAFLAGSIMDFHGRYHVLIKLYTVYTGSFVWEDAVIFSTEDLENALDEITGRLIAVLSGNKPAVITVKAEPEETLVLINHTFAGKGETASLEHPPGKITITASAPDYESMTVETELAPGERAEIDIRLHPLEYGNIEIPGPSSGGTVYHGALYVGETPLTLRLPLNLLEYVELETPDKKKGAIVFHTPDSDGDTYSFSLRTATPPEKGRVAKARRWHYWAWGGTWITGIAAWIAYQTYETMNAAVVYDSSITKIDNANFYKDYNNMWYIYGGALAAVAVAVAHEIFQMGRYVYTANKGSTAVVKPDRNSK